MENDSNFDQHQPVQTGNASNPSPRANEIAKVDEQVLSKQAEKYLREAGNIEDEPDALDQEEMDEEIRRQRNSDE